VGGEGRGAGEFRGTESWIPVVKVERVPGNPLSGGDGGRRRSGAPVGRGVSEGRQSGCNDFSRPTRAIITVEDIPSRLGRRAESEVLGKMSPIFRARDTRKS
jgi:hypothetical protein